MVHKPCHPNFVNICLFRCPVQLFRSMVHWTNPKHFLRATPFRIDELSRIIYFWGRPHLPLDARVNAESNRMFLFPHKNIMRLCFYSWKLPFRENGMPSKSLFEPSEVERELPEAEVRRKNYRKILSPSSSLLVRSQSPFPYHLWACGDFYFFFF